MSYFNDSKNWVIAILIILNIGLLTFMWIMRPPPPGKMPPKEFLLHDLDLDKNQKNQANALLEDYSDSNKRIRDQIRENKQEILIYIGSVNASETMVIDSLLNKEANLRQELDKNFVSLYQRLFDLCTEEQRYALKDVFEKLLGPPPHMRPSRRKPPGSQKR